MKLTVSNANITNTFSTARMTLGNASIVESLTIGNVSVTPSQISVGNVSITPTAVSVPALVLGGSQFSGGLQGGIINYQEFTANGTWYNPYANASVNASLTGYEQVFVMAWGGGGGGFGNSSFQSAGGGGACVIVNILAGQCNSVCNVVVGAGGNGVTTGTTNAFSGQTSVFWANSTFSISAYGGGGGSASTTVWGGGGGGWFSVGQNGLAGGAGGGPLGGAHATTGGASTFGGGGAGNTGGSGSSVYGGGGGAGSDSTRIGGSSIYGGGGGGGTAGVSVFGGNGGISFGAVPTGPATNGFVPGGGAGANNSSGMNGARGEVRVWVFGPAGTTAGAPTYALTANTTTLYEGSSVLYTVSTTNIANGTALYYTLNNSSTAVATDFTTAVNGSVVINGGTGTFELTANNDTDSANEAFQIDVRTGSTTGSIVASNGSVSIVPLPPITLVNRSTLTSISSTISSYNFSSQNIGTASSTRRVYVLIAADNGVASAFRSLSSVTIGGISADIHIQQTHQSGGFIVAGIASAVVTTGTTANIVVNFNDNMVRCGIFVISVNDVIDSTPIDTATSTGADPVSLNLDYTEDGLVLAIAGTSNVTGCTWTGINEQFDGGIPSTSSATGGDLFPTSSATNATISGNWSSPGARRVGVAMSVR